MVWHWLRSWWRHDKTQPRVVTMYTRRNCHLCEEATVLLEQFQALYHFTLEKIDIDTDPDLADLYGQEVPVVAIDGKVRFRGRINVVLLRRQLR